jgi:hypothetical protein
MSEDDHFNFLIMKDHDNGLVFVALDSVVGYIKHLSQELSEVSWRSDDPATTAVISRAFELLSERLEKMEPKGGGSKKDKKI